VRYHFASRAAPLRHRSVERHEQMSTAVSRRVAALNWLVALVVIASIGWCFGVARLAAEDAVRAYGHNVDSGAYVILFAIATLRSDVRFSHRRTLGMETQTLSAFYPR
jgi:hypothetical protein